jgi:hypothetical protein
MMRRRRRKSEGRSMSPQTGNRVQGKYSSREGNFSKPTFMAHS